MRQIQPAIRFSSAGETLAVPVINQLMALPLENPGILSLAAGFTDNDALPSQLVNDLVASLPSRFPRNDHLQYGTTQGRSRLRELSCEHVNGIPGEKEDAADPALTFITNGSQQALFLATLTLCDPGDFVLVESPSYFVYLSMLQGLQVCPLGIPAEECGRMNLTALDQILSRMQAEGTLPKIKTAYLIGYHANPSSRCLDLDEKTGFAAVLLRYGLIIPIIEDAAYRDLSYDTPYPVPSILSLPDYTPFPKLYLGTYTKPFATGLKVGYGICTNEEWMGKMLCAKGNQDFGTSNFNQVIVECMLEDGHYPAILRQLGTHYGRKAGLLHRVLWESGLRDRGWHWTKPEGGLLFWLKGPSHLDTRMEGGFCASCKEAGVIYVPGNFCFASGHPHHFIRLSIGALNDARLEEAASRFCEAALSQLTHPILDPNP